MSGTSPEVVPPPVSGAWDPVVPGPAGNGATDGLDGADGVGLIGEPDAPGAGDEAEMNAAPQAETATVIAGITSSRVRHERGLEDRIRTNPLV